MTVSCLSSCLFLTFQLQQRAAISRVSVCHGY